MRVAGCPKKKMKKKIYIPGGGEGETPREVVWRRGELGRWQAARTKAGKKMSAGWCMASAAPVHAAKRKEDKKK
jgi:hypothetical protein